MWNKQYYGSCGSCDCGPESISKADHKALLEEQAKILEAKLATIRHLIENIDKEPAEKEKIK